MATAYVPKAALRPRAGSAILFAAAVAGAAGGLASHMAARALYAAFLVPVAWGLAAGFAVSLAARHFRVANPTFAAVAAGVGVGVAAALQIGLDYRLDRHERALAAAEVYEMTSMGAGSTEFLEESYREKLEELSFARYLKRRYGMEAELDPAGGLASSLGPHGAIAVSAIELLLGGGIAIALARRQALEPACPRCGAWRTGARLGEAAHGVAGAVCARLETGDLRGAASLIAPPDTREAVVFTRLACPHGHDGGGGVLRVDERALDARRRARWHTWAELEASEEEVAAVAAALEERRS